MMGFKLTFLFLIGFFFLSCTKKESDEAVVGSSYAITLSFTRLDQVGFDPFKVTASLTENGKALSGQSLQLTVPRGNVGPITDLGDGRYEFVVTPSSTGVYPVQVGFGGASIRREALVVANLATGVGQPLAVPGDYVNSVGYEDGATITPDGNYLFIQYGPIYFSGLFLLSSICYNASYTMYDVLGCGPNADSNWVFNTIGPYNNSLRPHFPVGAIQSGNLTHINLTIPGVAHGIALFPTVFYGFKKQSDGTFAEPFKVAFNDVKGANGPFGLSFQMTSSTTANFVVAWNNYFNDIGGDQKPDIYAGTMTMGQTNNLGDVVYSGELFSSINPTITPVSFSSHTGVQGNPHLYQQAGVVKSIWTDDEQVSHDLSVYLITSGTYPTGTWSLITLPSKINTAGSESQPFFTGTRLYLTRDGKIIYHDYIGSGHADYHLNSSWGNEVVVLEAGQTSLNTLFSFGEPTIATVDGKNYLYFVYVKVRSLGVAIGRVDYDLDVGFVDVP